MSFLLINKPEGWTSFDAVAFVRNKVRSGVIPATSGNPVNTIKHWIPNQVGNDKGNISPKKIRIGHAGTLDPFATGLLIIGVGRDSTRLLDTFKKMAKTYIATIKLGEISDTQDKTGKITVCHPELVSGSHGMPNQVRHDSYKKPKRTELLETIKTFIGKQKQIPPMFSAKKINGQRLYNLARKGINIDRKPNEIEIYNIKVIKYKWPILKVEVHCSAGTYIRTLAHDIGQQLGTGAYCQELIRTQIGSYVLKKAININKLK